MEFLLDKVKATKTNSDFFDSCAAAEFRPPPPRRYRGGSGCLNRGPGF
jgi:hypothetical protein